MAVLEERYVYKVSEVTEIIRSILEGSPIADLWVEGEVSNFKRATSGHLYFTLKDSDSQIRCVIFKSSAERMRFMPEDGISIILHGKLTVYGPQGCHQIIGTRIEPLGLGALQLAFEQLKKKLAAEGLFDESHKKPIPLVPQRVGVVTSITGAAVRDIINVIGRRFPNIPILIYPVAVQGEGAPREIAEAIDAMNSIGDLDVLIVGRGGGSAEDLWAFNAEIVARSIYASKIPVISAVGHEIDFTIADFVADLRAATPSAAAEIVVANKADLIKTLVVLVNRMNGSMGNRLQNRRKQLAHTQDRLLLRSGQDRIQSFQQNIDDLLSRAENVLVNSIERRKSNLKNNRDKLNYIGLPARISEIRQKAASLEQMCVLNMQHLLESKGDDFKTLAAKLNVLSPLSILQRGYSICFQYPDKKMLRSADKVSAGDKIGVKLARGEIICTVEETLTD